MQRAARAFREQAEVVGVEAEVEVERALCADVAVDRERGAAGAEAQLVEGPVVAAPHDVPAAGRRVAAQAADEIAERDVELGLRAERLAARLQVEVQRAAEAG